MANDDFEEAPLTQIKGSSAFPIGESEGSWLAIWGCGMKRITASVFASLALVSASAAQASETVTYTYDAKGRLIKVVHTGTVNNGVTTQYTHDHADNRTNVKVTGAP